MARITETALRVLKTAAFGALGLVASGCTVGDRLANIGKAPDLSQIENPTTKPDYKPVSLPMPRPDPQVYAANSLWRTGAKAFFQDQRAQQIGDILTVLIEIEDQATINNSSTRQRNNTEQAELPQFLGVQSNLGNFLPDEVSPEELVDFGSNTTNSGSGTIQRDESIELRIAALVSQELPNGNLVIQGRQEVRVNYEVRELIVTGVIRPEDITSGNTINYDQIAEARVSYGGRGQITDVQQPRYGQQLYDIIFPF